MVVKALLNLIGAILGIFKRLMCFLNIKKGRRNSGSILPLHSDTSVKENPVTHSLPSNDHADLELESWENWGETGGFNSGNQTNKHGGNHAANQVQGGYYGNKGNVDNLSTQEEEDVNFFEDMTPKIKKQQKILVRKKEDASQRHEGFSKRLTVGSEIPLEGGPELGAWEDSENAWGDELTEDLSWEAKSAIKERKRQEREQRQLEQQRKRQEKEVLKTQRQGQLTAVRLS